jgi:hypothetical protein
MPTTPIAGKILVSIVSAVVQAVPPAWHLEYEVRNRGTTTIWLVTDESLVLRQLEGRIELSYARGRMMAGAQVFGYFDPKVVALEPGKSLRQRADVGWPCRLSDLWNDRREAAPPAGDYDVTVRVGFASTAAPGPPQLGEGVEAAVLRWQQEALSPPVRLAIPAYGSSQ